VSLKYLSKRYKTVQQTRAVHHQPIPCPSKACIKLLSNARAQVRSAYGKKKRKKKKEREITQFSEQLIL